MSLLLLYRPRYEELEEIGGFAPEPKKRKKRAKKLKAPQTVELLSVSKIEEIVKDQQQLIVKIKEKKDKWDEDELLLFMFLDD